jgi:hypothetical protein
MTRASSYTNFTVTDYCPVKVILRKIQFGKCRYEFEKAPSYPGNGKN